MSRRAIARAVLTIVGPVCLLAGSACGEPLIGDPGYSVIVKNGMTEPLIFYVDDVGASLETRTLTECDSNRAQKMLTIG